MMAGGSENLKMNMKESLLSGLSSMLLTEPIRHAMNLSGDRDELQRFCDEFPANLEAFNAHVQETTDLTGKNNKSDRNNRRR